MAEKEYIERKKLKQAFSTDTQNIRSWDVDLFDLLMIVIDEAPDADVVEVVRCKDCIYRGQEECAMFYRCDCGEQLNWETDNDFCSYGERIVSKKVK